MVFSSHLFLFWFLPLVLLLDALAPARARNGVLALASYAFYGWANPAFVLLMLFSTVVDWLCGLVLAGVRPERLDATLPRLDPQAPRSRSQRVALWVSIATNLGLLGFFKYSGLFVDTANAVAERVGAGPALALGFDVVLPLGISFYTFQSMSYTIDVYRGRCTALANPIDFACYVAMFPQLVAGPIVRFREVADQLRARTRTLEKRARGVAFFALGLAKKILIANPCGETADLAFDAASLEPLDAWIGLIAYAFQIYFDFSGYSDMAIGLGLMLGFVFPKNFDSPYRSRSITEFWRRWHLSLSRWLRDYLYIPLGGNRKGRTRTYLHLAVVMLLGGLWHGAAWTFVAWGALHGVLLAAERAWRERRGRDADAEEGRDSRGADLVRLVTTFALVNVGWVLFRSADFPSALAYYRSLLGLSDSAPAAALVAAQLRVPGRLAVLLLAAAVTWGAPQTWDWTRRLPPARIAAVLGLFALAIAVLEVQGANPFLYFVF